MALKIDAKMLGGPAVRRAIEEAARKHPQALNRALYQQGVAVWGASVRLAPVEFAVMRTSAYASPPTDDGRTTFVEVGYGTKYSIFQHENPNLRHPRGGEDHYLSKAVERVASLDTLARWTAENIASGKGAATISGRRPPTAPRVDETLRERKRAERKARRQKRREGK